MSNANMTREQWVEVFAAIGMDEATMRKWHGEFEHRYPVQHQAFLEWIGLPTEEILRIRKFSKTG